MEALSYSDGFHVSSGLDTCDSFHMARVFIDLNYDCLFIWTLNWMKVSVPPPKLPSNRLSRNAAEVGSAGEWNLSQEPRVGPEYLGCQCVQVEYVTKSL